MPLSAYGAEAVDKAEALTHLNIGLAIETVAELAELEVSSKVSGAAGSVGGAGGAEPSASGLARAEACTHYARSAELDSSGSYVFTLWGAAAARDASLESDAARRAAAARVYSRGVEAGHWAVAEQRPVTLVRGLTATAWHEPQAFAVCRALEAAFGQIREEASWRTPNPNPYPNRNPSPNPNPNRNPSPHPSPNPNPNPNPNRHPSPNPKPPPSPSPNRNPNQAAATVFEP